MNFKSKLWQKLLASEHTLTNAGSFGYTTLTPKQDVMNTTTSFLDSTAEIEIKQGILPHWQQKGVYYFVTFRLANSIPNK